MYSFITGRYAPSLTIACPRWSPVRDLGCPRDLWCQDTKLRGLVRRVLLARGAAVRALVATCAPSPCASKLLWKPEAFPLRGLGPPRTERVWRVASVARSGPGELLLALIYFRFGRTRVCITPIGLHRVKIIGSFRFFGERTAASNRASSRIIHCLLSVYYMFALLFSLAYYVVLTHIWGHIACPSPPSPLPAMVGGIVLKSIFCFLLGSGERA